MQTTSTAAPGWQNSRIVSLIGEDEMLNDSFYLFVEVAAQRTMQLMRGAKPKLDVRAHKYSTIACAEVRGELIPWEAVTDEQIVAELAEKQAVVEEEMQAEIEQADLARAELTPAAAKAKKA
jgi:DNA-directed RNA polymerase subunit K/omega